MSSNSITHLIFICLGMFLSFSCKNPPSIRINKGEEIAFKYAKNISMEKYDSFTVVKMKNPWKKDQLLHTCILISKSKKIPHDLPNGTIVRVPLTNTLVTTSMHCQLLEWFGVIDAVGGVCDMNYINIPLVQQLYHQKKIIDCGSSMAPNIEKIMELHPDAILISPFENSGGYGKLDKLNIPIIELADYMESSPLARAEWMKFYALLYGKSLEGEKLFSDVESKYMKLKEIAARQKDHVSVLPERMMGSVWYLPGGKSTIAQLIRDAGGKYPYSIDKHSGSISVAPEKVLEDCGNSDVWLYKYDGHPSSYKELLSESPIYGQFKAFKHKNVYICNTMQIPYFDEIPFRPERLLRDFILIFHPKVKGLGKLRYYKKMIN